MEPDEGIEDEEFRAKSLDRLAQRTLLGGDVDTKHGDGDHVDRKRLEVDACGGCDSFIV